VENNIPSVRSDMPEIGKDANTVFLSPVGIYRGKKALDTGFLHILNEKLSGRAASWAVLPVQERREEEEVRATTTRPSIRGRSHRIGAKWGSFAGERGLGDLLRRLGEKIHFKGSLA